jgi:hypothetical protein
MSRPFTCLLLGGVLAGVILGCETQPPAVRESTTTIVEEDEAIDAPDTTVQPDNGVEVGVGGGQGVDVNVNRGSSGTNAPGATTDINPTGNPDTAR